jgi:hypothetical protein
MSMEATMRAIHVRSMLMAAALIAMLVPLHASAGQDDGTPVNVTAGIVLPPATFPVYLVPYMRAGDSAATVVSITNLGDTPCTTSVDWKTGVGGVACSTFLTHAGGSPVGDTLDHCTNPNAVGCNATCAQPAPFGFRAEGAAIVRAELHCRTRIAVDARLYYSTSTGEVAGLADLKVIKLPGANKGE